MNKHLKRILIAVAVFLAILIILAVLTIAAPLKYSYTVAEAEADSALVGEIADIISDALIDEDDNIPEIVQVTIPPEHVGALLRIAGYRVNRELKDEGVLCALAWENASIKAEASYHLPLSLEVTLRGNAVPSLENGVLHVPVSGLKAGLLPLPGALLVRDISEQDIRDENLKLAFEAVHHVSVSQDGGLDLGVYPEKISNLIRLLVSQDD